ncbi:MAG TPA: hypothetical protein VGM22_01420 [Methylomirabilota bacterium]
MGKSFHSFGCLECGAPLCAACAISLESASYCASCAADLLETRTVRAGRPFDLQ